MNPTKNDLPEATRGKVAAVLNGVLGHLLDLQLRTKQAHWNVKGSNFIAVHELFDDVFDAVRERVDEVAERVVALGGFAEGTLPAVQATSKLPAYPTDISQSRDHLDALSTSMAAVGKAIRAAIPHLEDLGDHGSADLLTASSRELDKYLWFVEAHLQG